MSHHAVGTRSVGRAPSIAGAYKDNLVELISRLASAGRNDPDIAARLGITASQVRRLRAEFAVSAGERRWLPVRNLRCAPLPEQD